MHERRQGERYGISMPIRLKWKDTDGSEIVEEGLTENVGLQDTLVYLPRKLPSVGARVDLMVTENANNEISVIAQVIRLERNASHPQVALTVVEGMHSWETQVYNHAAEVIAGQEPEALDDWQE